MICIITSKEKIWESEGHYWSASNSYSDVRWPFRYGLTCKGIYHGNIEPTQSIVQEPDPSPISDEAEVNEQEQKSNDVVDIDILGRWPNVRAARIDRAIKVLVSRCDICGNPIPGLPDNFELRIDALNEMNDIDEPRLLLCNTCKKEYNIPSWM